MQGAQEVFKELPHEFVSPDSLEDVVKNGGMFIFYGHKYNIINYVYDFTDIRRRLTLKQNVS